MPRDVEIKIEDLNRRWIKGDIIPDIDRESFFRPRRNRVKKKKRLKTRYVEKQNKTTSQPDSKIYFTQIIKDRPTRIEEEKLSKSTKNSNQEIKDSTDILDSYSPYIYAELLKENNTSDTTNETDYSDEYIEVYDATTEAVELVTLEVAVVDSSANNDSDEKVNKTQDAFLPYIPLSGIDFEFDITAIGEDIIEKENDTIVTDYDDLTPYPRQETASLSLKSEPWAFPVLVVGSSVLSLLVLYHATVIFSLTWPLSLSSHCLLVSMMMATISTMMLTLTPTTTLCTTIRQRV